MLFSEVLRRPAAEDDSLGPGPISADAAQGWPEASGT